ncbi:efflux RND transporter periplasmic adaptor subunit [Chitinophaga sancti]|uniref:Efflux RND transporter periplasmic adaptor subunit n=1 Tax=Chitinophaga sancti TaxID=1004 RepID=A0A1K1PTF4_9BACT|nr:efflux RND transporter periplasmic adaptor subunit [Chitinophaga sancti]WQD61663.1 efflux RND transporter periplasmic adaptor subunit [Chitinophaga sancti]WQG92780.1 efflux RND transporter periplasmic adaptor subunit [Chitinophaga sancti]SFW50841.1 membrane fusion protein, multidrug efflux system [Chitinophaga sancti]
MKTKQHILLIGATGMFFLASCKGPEQKGAMAMPATKVNVTAATMGQAIYYDKYPASVVALNQVELRAQVSGYITGIFFKEGEVVQKGKALYEIDRRKYEAAVRQAEANLASAKATLVRAQKDANRYHELAKQDAIARQTLDNADATLETSRASVAAAEAALLSTRTDLDYSVIKAPFTGRIGISQVKLGAQISQGSTLLNTMSSENPIAVDIVVSETDIPRFSAMQGKTITPNDSTFRLTLPGGIPYSEKGKILAVDRGVDNQTATIKVRIEFANPKDELKDGMSAVLQVLNEQSGENVIIPYRAVVEQMGEFFVFVAKDTIAEQRKIHLGPKLRDRVVISDGLKAGEVIITDGFNRLRDGGAIDTSGVPKQPQQGPGQAPKK